MEEKRRHKRLDLDVSLQLERLDEDGVTTLKYVHVDVTDSHVAGWALFQNRSWQSAVFMIPRFRFGPRKL